MCYALLVQFWSFEENTFSSNGFDVSLSARVTFFVRGMQYFTFIYVFAYSKM